MILRSLQKAHHTKRKIHHRGYHNCSYFVSTVRGGRSSGGFIRLITGEKYSTWYNSSSSGFVSTVTAGVHASVSRVCFGPPFDVQTPPKRGAGAGLLPERGNPKFSLASISRARTQGDRTQANANAQVGTSAHAGTSTCTATSTHANASTPAYGNRKHPHKNKHAHCDTRMPHTVCRPKKGA